VGRLVQNLLGLACNEFPFRWRSDTPSLFISQSSVGLLCQNYTCKDPEKTVLFFVFSPSCQLCRRLTLPVKQFRASDWLQSTLGTRSKCHTYIHFIMF